MLITSIEIKQLSSEQNQDVLVNEFDVLITEGASIIDCLKCFVYLPQETRARIIDKVKSRSYDDNESFLRALESELVYYHDLLNSLSNGDIDYSEVFERYTEIDLRVAMFMFEKDHFRMQLVLGDISRRAAACLGML